MNYEIEMMKYANNFKKVSLNKKIGIEHKKRKYGDTQIFHVWRLPKIALINFIGLLRVKFDLLIN